jgi:hypothetical protein
MGAFSCCSIIVGIGVGIKVRVGHQYIIADFVHGGKLRIRNILIFR